jgi:hypothetical protein
MRRIKPVFAVAAIMALTVRSKMMRLLATQHPFIPASSQLALDA